MLSELKSSNSCCAELSSCMSGLITLFEGRDTQTGSWRNTWQWFYQVGWLASTGADESFRHVRLTAGNQYLALLRPTTALIHRFSARYTRQTAAEDFRFCSFWLNNSHWIFFGTVTNSNPAFSSYLKRRRKRMKPRCFSRVHEFKPHKTFLFMSWKCSRYDTIKYRSATILCKLLSKTFIIIMTVVTQC